MSADSKFSTGRALLAVFGAGLMFGAGLALSGMTHPEKVLDFLDLAGPWDPSLLFVLAGATGVASIAFPRILRLTRPLLARHFDLPDTTAGIDHRLAIGAVLFGLGWGVSGYCPGPAIALLAALPDSGREALIFLPSMLAGLWLARLPMHTSRRQSTPHGIADVELRMPSS